MPKEGTHATPPPVSGMKCAVNFGSGRILAWNIGITGQQDTLGGIVVDDPIGPEKYIMGHVSRFRAGFIDVGLNGDKHLIGKDDQGHAIHAAHIWTGSLYRTDNTLDAPMKFEGKPPEDQEPEGGKYSKWVHLEYWEDETHPFICGARRGIWKWRAESDTRSRSPIKRHRQPQTGGTHALGCFTVTTPIVPEEPRVASPPVETPSSPPVYTT